jgi:succinate dehydrogenase assembly factor 1
LRQETQAHFRAHILGTFRRQAASVQAKDFSTIEFLLRRGRKQLEQLQDPQLLDIHPGTR